LKQPSLLEPDEFDPKVTDPRHEGEERFFEMLDIEEAAVWARRGGIAVHRNFDVTGMEIGGRIRSGQAYHVMCLNRDTLVAWGEKNGQRERWLQPPKREDAHGLFGGIWHYDVFGGPARRMERRMGIPPLE